MTDQYQQNNINAPRGSEFFDADAELTLDDDLVVVSTAAGVVTLTLPRAEQIPGQEIKFKADDAGSTGNTVDIVPQPGETIDGLAVVQLETDQESVCLKSDGTNWRLVCGGSGSSEVCCAPQVAVSFPVSVGQGASIVFSVAGCNLLTVATITPKNDPNAPPAILPTVNDFIAVPGGATVLESLDIDVNTDGASGDFYMEIVNECGCCTLFAMTVLPA